MSPTTVTKQTQIWIKKKDSARYVDNNRVKYLSAEDYYNNKYPKRNITFPRIEPDRKNIHTSKTITLYNVDVRTILNSKSFRLPKMNAGVPKKQRLVSSAINYIERKTGFDIDGDEDIGVSGNPADRHNQIALNGLRWVIDNIRYTQLNDTGELIPDSGLWSSHRRKNILNEPVTEIEAMVLNGENWSFSYQTLERKNGDCEDGAILLYDILRKSGIPAWKLRLNAGFMRGGGGHCWLSYYVESQFWKNKRDDKWVILDWCDYSDIKANRETKVEDRSRHSELKEYATIDFSFNEDYTWSFGELLFAPIYHAEGCSIFQNDFRGFDWGSKFCTCGYSVKDTSQ
tara:strand:+ start:145 stop:1173 length:1029 start_codon:yes stop_codon:yes gene_type:complete